MNTSSLVSLPRTLALCLLTIALLAAPERAEAQLLEVRQTVFGMDCAPCAYGLEKRLKKIDGVTSARVSLNDGLATAALDGEAPTRLATIREAIRESGFAAQEAVVTARGTLRQAGGVWVLVLPGGERFVVDAGTTALTAGRRTLTGRVAKGGPDGGGAFRLVLETSS